MLVNLMSIRKNKGYSSRKDFAEALGVSERQVKSWETGERKLYLYQACDICDVLGCTLDELVGRKPPFSPQQISRDEQSLLNVYRTLDDQQKLTVVSSAVCMSPNRTVKAEKTRQQMGA